jgi:hypothetical protein
MRGRDGNLFLMFAFPDHVTLLSYNSISMVYRPVAPCLGPSD